MIPMKTVLMTLLTSAIFYRCFILIYQMVLDKQRYHHRWPLAEWQLWSDKGKSERSRCSPFDSNRRRSRQNEADFLSAERDAECAPAIIWWSSTACSICSTKQTINLDARKRISKPNFNG